METLRIQRRSARQEAAREVGTNYGAPTGVADQLETALSLGTLMTLPTIPVPSPMITDPSNPNVGKFKFILGLSRLGGPDIMI